MQLDVSMDHIKATIQPRDGFTELLSRRYVDVGDGDGGGGGGGGDSDSDNVSGSGMREKTDVDTTVKFIC